MLKLADCHLLVTGKVVVCPLVPLSVVSGKINSKNYNRRESVVQPLSLEGAWQLGHCLG